MEQPLLSQWSSTSFGSDCSSTSEASVTSNQQTTLPPVAQEISEVSGILVGMIHNETGLPPPVAGMPPSTPINPAASLLPPPPVFPMPVTAMVTPNVTRILPPQPQSVHPIVPPPPPVPSPTPFQNAITDQLPNTTEAQMIRLAAEMKNEGRIVGNLTDGEKKMKEGAQVGSSKYIKSIDRLMESFFQINLENTDNNIIKSLCVKGWDDNNLSFDFIFYHRLSGPRAEWKRQYVNLMLTMFFLRRGNKKTPGKPLDSNTFKQYTKMINSRMRKRGIPYDLTSDFKGIGEFKSVVTTKWAEYREADPKFATKSHAAQIDENADEKFQTVLEDGTLKPFETYWDLIVVTVFMLGRYCLFRGRSEISNLTWDRVEFGKYTSGPDKGIRYVKVWYPFWDKVRPLTLKNAVIRVGEKGSVFVREQIGNPYCPYKIFEKLRQVCHPDQKRVFCYPAGENQLAEYHAERKGYLSYPNKPIGPQPISKYMRNVGKICNFENWEAFTNHGGRKLGITMMLEAGGDDTAISRQSRHAGPESMKDYKKNTKQMESRVQDQLMGTHLAERFLHSDTPTKNTSPPPKKVPSSPSPRLKDPPPPKKVPSSPSPRLKDPPPPKKVLLSPPRLKDPPPPKKVLLSPPKKVLLSPPRLKEAPKEALLLPSSPEIEVWSPPKRVRVKKEKIVDCLLSPIRSTKNILVDTPEKASLKRALAESEEALTAKQRKLKDRKKERKVAKGKIAELRTELTSLKKDFLRMEQEKSSLSKKYEELRKKHEVQSKKHDNLVRAHGEIIQQQEQKQQCIIM